MIRLFKVQYALGMLQMDRSQASEGVVGRTGTREHHNYAMYDGGIAYRGRTAL